MCAGKFTNLYGSLLGCFWESQTFSARHNNNKWKGKQYNDETSLFKSYCKQENEIALHNVSQIYNNADVWCK